MAVINDVLLERAIKRLEDTWLPAYAGSKIFGARGDKVWADVHLLRDVTLLLLKQMQNEIHTLEDDKHHMFDLLDKRVKHLESLFLVQEVHRSPGVSIPSID